MGGGVKKGGSAHGEVSNVKVPITLDPVAGKLELVSPPS